MLSDADRAKFWSYVSKSSGCWNWTRSVNHGYGQIWFNGVRWIASRLAWVLTYGPIENSKHFVLHRCDNPRCVRPDHLFLGTQTQNLHDMRLKKRGATPPHRRGCFNNKTRFADDDVRAIRARYANGDSLRVLGKAYRVWHTTIADIVHRKTWTHIT
jgi:hypothetical protein